jgi:DNA-damage-inducible protein D
VLLSLKFAGMSTIDIFDRFSDDFENNSRENGFTYWLASDLMHFLEYESWTSFNKAINKAMTTCNVLNVPIMENFEQISTLIDGKNVQDFKLSRVACYLVVMNGDNKKYAVAQAQGYFASLAGAVHNYMVEVENVERINIRSEISDREASLSGVAHKAGVQNYPFFQNAGYRGMYNQNITRLKSMRNVPAGKSLLDFMGKDELAANLFRITQTELKIKQDNVHGQSQLENAAETVGRKVRQTMLDISGVAPENLTKAEDINNVKKELKNKSKKIKLIDKKKPNG